MQYIGKRLAGAVLLGALWAGSASGAIIYANDDTYLDQQNGNTNRDNPGTGLLSTAGILMKNQTGQQRIGLMEFTLPNTAVTGATINVYYFRSWSAGVAWTMQISGKAASFDETTITWNNASGITGGTTNIGPVQNMPGGNSGQDVVPGLWYSVDMTSFFNANLGQTVTLVLRSTSSTSSGTAGGTVEDREASRTGNTANVPYISYVPEPASALLLLGALPLIRRRRA